MRERETERVLGELQEFSQRIMPDLAKRVPVIFGVDPEATTRSELVFQSLEGWQDAADRLAGVLKARGAGKGGGCLVDEFSDFVRSGQASGGYEVRGDGIHWQYSLYADVVWEQKDFWWLPEECQPHQAGGVAESIAATRKWFLEASQEDGSLWNALCSDLPALADLDPRFALSMLHPEAYRDRILSNERLTEERREAELRKSESFHFRHVRNNALLHVVAALANNHFLKIHRFVQILDYNGPYSGLIPHYVFAILLAKVSVLVDSNTGPVARG